MDLFESSLVRFMILLPPFESIESSEFRFQYSSFNWPLYFEYQMIHCSSSYFDLSMIIQSSSDSSSSSIELPTSMISRISGSISSDYHRWEVNSNDCSFIGSSWFNDNPVLPPFSRIWLQIGFRVSFEWLFGMAEAETRVQTKLPNYKATKSTLNCFRVRLCFHAAWRWLSTGPFNLGIKVIPWDTSSSSSALVTFNSATSRSLMIIRATGTASATDESDYFSSHFEAISCPSTMDSRAITDGGWNAEATRSRIKGGDRMHCEIIHGWYRSIAALNYAWVMGTTNLHELTMTQLQSGNPNHDIHQVSHIQSFEPV